MDFANQSVFNAARPIRRYLQHGIEGTLQLTGASRLYVRVRGLAGAVVLMYHSVAERETAQWIDPRNWMDPETFRDQMRLIAQSYRVVSMTELAHAVSRGQMLPAGTVAINFDDGYLDNLTIAAPVLAELDVPATIYLPTAYIERGEVQWIDELYSMFRARTRQFFSTDTVNGSPFDLRNTGERHASYRAIAEVLLTASPHTRRGLLDEVAAQLRPSAGPPRLTMDWDDVRRLRKECPNVEIGVHTREHIDLTACETVSAEAEIRDCICDAEREIGERPVHFSFPYGRWSESAARLLRELGFTSAVGSGDDCLLQGGIDPFRIPRIAAPASMTRFRFVTSGAYPSLSRMLLGRS